jgi:hypothetical protein
MTQNCSENRESARGRVEMLEQHLRDLVGNAATPVYVKSRELTDELDCSVKELGSIWPTVQNRENSLQVEKWGKSSGITWQVTTADGGAE